ncbi:hypothetical protein OPT61_g7674 [Boeremia exigua]|uniref:Uncharacterized protein n=1 Tax=Boeremia exigua TaxID=749465 RepID=A0ACC2I1V0_9PLEO|nr:hypothetical protein OPT61_g7674 [Boeremia exigua]
MRSTISTLAAVAAGLLASTVSAQGKVAIYWGQGPSQQELSVVCKDPRNACGGEYFKNPDGTTSKFLASCGIITTGISECRKNGKKVMLSLGGGYPTDYYLANDDAAKWLAEVLVGSFGPQTNSAWPRPFGASFVDGFDLDIESSSAVGAQKYQFYAELVNYIKKLSPGMLISSAPQCVLPDAHLDDAITRAPFDYVFTQFYNTDACSAKRGWNERNQQQTGFNFNLWAQRLQQRSFNKNVKLFMGLPAGPEAANSGYYLTPEQANDLITKYKTNAMWGGVMLWEAAASQRNVVYGQGYSSWIKYSIDGTFKQNYHPVVSSTIRPSSTLVSSTRSSTIISKTSTAVSSTISSTKSSVVPSSTKSSVVPSSTKSSVAPSSTKSSVAPSSTVKPSSSSVASSTIKSSSSAVTSSTIKSSSSAVSSSTIDYTDYFSTALPTEYSVSSTTAEPSTVYPEDVSSTVAQSSSATAEPSTVYPEDVSSTAVQSSSTADVTSSYYETSSTPAVTSSASDYSDASSSTAYDVSSSTAPVDASSTPCTTSTELYPESSKVPEASSSSVEYPTESSEVPEASTAYSASLSTPADASSTPCTTSTELYPESSKTPEASTASESLTYSESSKVPEASSSVSSYPVEYPTESSKTPEASSSASSYPVEYPTESSKTPEASTAYSASSSTPADASSTPCTTSTELYPTSSKTPEASSATDYTVEYPSSYPTVSTKTPEASSSASEYPIVSVKTPELPEFEFYSTATPTVTKPAESTTTVVTTTYLDTCSTGLTTKTAVITKTVCNACTKPSDKPEADYPSDWTTSVYVSKTLTVTITKPIHSATDVPAYPTIVSEYPTAPKPSAPAAEYPIDKEEIPSYETPAKSSSVPYEATKPSPKPEVPSAEYPVASSKPSSQYVTLTKVATPTANTAVPYPTPIGHQSYPVGNGTVPSGTGAVKPSATGTGKPVKPTSYTPPEFEGAASKLSMGMTGVVAVVAFLMFNAGPHY